MVRSDAATGGGVAVKGAAPSAPTYQQRAPPLSVANPTNWVLTTNPSIYVDPGDFLNPTQAIFDFIALAETRVETIERPFQQSINQEFCLYWSCGEAIA